MTELRRFILDPAFDPNLTRLGTIVNRLIDRDNGSAAGRIWLLGDDGDRQEILGGDVIDSNNYPLRVEPGSTNQLNILHSNGSTIGLRVQDTGLTTGVPASLSSTLAVTGATTLTGALTANGAVTLGDAAGDVITVTGTMTVTPLATFTAGIATGTLPATTGPIRMTNTGFITWRNAANSGDILAVGVFSDDNLYLGIASGSPTPSVVARASTSVHLRVGLTDRVVANGTGIGFFNTTPVAQPAAGAAATDPASTQTLANALRTGLRALGLFS